MMRNQVWLAGAMAVLVAAWSGGVQAQDTPRKGGTIRFTSPYAASFGSLDLHTTPRATDEIVGKAINRTLYNWDSANNKLALELATSVSTSADGLVHTFKLRDDAYFHNGRKMTADDVIASFTRIMDGAKAYPGARFVRIIKGAIDVEKGQAKEISGLKKIDDFTLEMTLTDRVDPGYYFFDGITAILPKEEFEKPNFASNPVGLGPFKFKEHIPGSRVVVERWEKFYKPGKPYADRLVFVIMAEAAARDVAFRNKEIDTSILGPAQYVAYRADPQLSKGILEVAEMFTRAMRMNPSFKPFSDKRVRQAINHALDRETFVKGALSGIGEAATMNLPSDRPCESLSSGMKRRVLIARAIVAQPDLLLLDEPFGALDAFTREELWCTLRDLQAAQKFNVILVTHDLRESVFLADTVYVMSKSPGRFVVRREIDLPRPRDLEITYTPQFTDIVHELRGHIGAMRRPDASVAT